jgi:hypothetical protein
MATDLMLDIETLGWHYDTVVLSLGAIKFDPYTQAEPHSGIYFRVDVDQQLKLGRSTDQDTLDWWASQPQDIQDEALSETDRIGVAQVLSDLNRTLVGVRNIWCQGPHFDITILEHLYRQTGTPVPWQFWQIRDSRTLFGLGYDPRSEIRTDAHNALADCYYQALAVQKVFKRLGIKP